MSSSHNNTSDAKPMFAFGENLEDQRISFGESNSHQISDDDNGSHEGNDVEAVDPLPPVRLSQGRRGSALHRNSIRRDHLKKLCLQRKVKRQLLKLSSTLRAERRKQENLEGEASLDENKEVSPPISEASGALEIVHDLIDSLSELEDGIDEPAGPGDVGISIDPALKESLRRLSRSLRPQNKSDGVPALSSSLEPPDESIDHPSAVVDQFLLSTHPASPSSELGRKAKEVDVFLKAHSQGPHPIGDLEYPLEVRMDHFSYRVPLASVEDANRIPTVYNSSFLYSWSRSLRKLRTWLRSSGLEKRESANSPPPQMKDVLSDICLVFEPGKNYLVLGPPQSGKSSLLKAIAGRLGPFKKGSGQIEGQVLYNGKELHVRMFILSALRFGSG
jgi:ABC-type multidrug transport system fused ATPase/permease subunit